ncbi:SRPBCC family protein [Tritonibacter horizontis]|uniref:Polyketide cyclase / dehydrase and lipid transport n=1 Tax=Tritonibacter horizontis TaxID=1768241 RepID=A0A132BTP3_9RHOB|nr:SRPBCC family protein [Tritonibacter horizontis]KUP91187.1 hypothetical protein TRIHO_39650 [Tritonibacter horizontis]
MQFETKEDIEGPIADIFAAITDFDTFERSAIRRGVEVQRHGTADNALTDLSWDVTFVFRGTERKMKLDVAESEPPNAIALVATGSGMVGDMKVELLALSPRRTRMTVQCNLTPKTLAARLLVQSLKLARSKLNRKFRLRVAEFARATEERLGVSV